MPEIQHEDLNVSYWHRGANDEWYGYRVERFDKNERVIMDKSVLVAVDDTSRYYIDSKYLAHWVADHVADGARIRLKPTTPFIVKKIKTTGGEEQ